jgi:hypothetical protein
VLAELDLARAELTEFAGMLTGRLQLVAIIDRPHALAGAGTADLAEWVGVTPFVEMRAESGLRLQADAIFERAGLSRRIAFELSTSVAVVRYVALGSVPRSCPCPRRWGPMWRC